MEVKKVKGGYEVDGVFIPQNIAEELADYIFEEYETEYCNVCMENDLCRREVF